MTKALRAPAVLALHLLLAVSVSSSAEDDGVLHGWVEDTRGTPVAGAVISLFGRGVGATGLITLSDSTGRFILASVPAGSYTLRALRSGHLPWSARQVTVLPNRNSTFKVSLVPEGEASAAEAKPENETAISSAKEGRRELTWLLRHKRRSVMEARSAVPPAGESQPPRHASLAPWAGALGGTLELVTHPETVGLGDESLAGNGPAASLSALRVGGRLSDSGSWSLGGLVSESGSMSWRMAAEFVLQAGDEHEIRAGSGYGTRMLRSTLPGEAGGDERVGAVFIQDRWQPSETFAATVGGRFSHLGFLARANQLDPSATLEVKPTSNTAVRGSVVSRTLAPGGDLLALSTLSTAPAVAYAAMDQDLRAERSLRVEVVVEEHLGPTTVRAHTFYETVNDHLGNSFSGRSARSLRIFNAGRVGTRGMGVTVARSFGDVVSGSMTYTYGHGWRGNPLEETAALATVHPLLTFHKGDFHDLVARLETVIDWSDTRVAAFYRVNSLRPQGSGQHATVSTRFDVQLSQGLPLLGQLTHADWDLLLAIRNLYYEVDEGAVLDEVAVLNPPTRVLGGIAVRF